VSRTAQTARIILAANESAKPLFTPSLRYVAARAVEAAEAYSACVAKPADEVTDEEFNRVQEAEFDTLQALYARLWIDHGIDRELARKIGGLL
jgi:hypothetical protein